MVYDVVDTTEVVDGFQNIINVDSIISEIYSTFVYRQVLTPFSTAKLYKLSDTGKKMNEIILLRTQKSSIKSFAKIHLF